MSGEALPRRRVRWGCVLGAVLLVVIAFVIVVPGLLMSGRAPNQRNASSSLKSLFSGNADFRSNDRDGNEVNDYWVGDVSALYFLQRGGEAIKLIEPSVANADGAPLAPLPDRSPRAGYLYAVMKIDETGQPYDQGGGRNRNKFAYCAYPEKYKEGSWPNAHIYETKLSFIINEDGVMWKKDLKGAPATQWPRDLAAEGWTKLD